MHFLKTLGVIYLLVFLAGCVSNNKTPRLDKDAQTQAFELKSESFRRGLRGSTTQSRPSAVLLVTYKLQCLSDGERAAEDRFKEAKSILEEAYVVAPLYFDNPRERSAWSRSATRRIIEPTGCEVRVVTFEDKGLSAIEATLWALKNGVPPVKRK